jgi:aryl-alcohol dehydrogenase-like predicted oxidoreductase
LDSRDCGNDCEVFASPATASSQDNNRLALSSACHVDRRDRRHVYSEGDSEEMVGEALQGRRDDVVLATKFFVPMGEDPNTRGGSRRWIMREVEDSLRRLQTDHIDLYQVHRPSADTDVEETVGALTDLVRQSKVRYIGSSSYSASQIVEAQWASRERRLERYVTEQPPYSILVPGIEQDVLPTTQRHGMDTLTYSPLSGGWLSGAWSIDSPPTSPARRKLGARFDMALPANQRKLEVVEQLAKLAEGESLTLIELGIAFAINHPGRNRAAMLALPPGRIARRLKLLRRSSPPGQPGVVVGDRWAAPRTRSARPAAR